MPTEGETSPQILASIPNTVVTHVLGESNAELGRGDLTLILTQSADVVAPAPPTSRANHTPLLTLTIGKAAFPLFKTTVFGTLADDVRTYVFTPEIGGEVGGYVKVTLPEEVTIAGSPFEKLQTEFERVLIDYGLLKEGIEAVADEIGKSMREDSVDLAGRIRDSTSEHLSQNPPTESPVSIPEGVHAASSTSASGTETFASAARRMSNAVGAVAGQAGAWVAGHIVPTTTPAMQTINSVSNAYESAEDGYRAGTGEVRDALADAVSQRAQNAYGEDAKDVLADTGVSAQNVSAAVGNVVVVTSGAGLVTEGIKGAAGRQTKKQEAKVRADREKAEDEDTWNDVSI